MKNAVMQTVRLVAASLVLVFGPGILVPQPLLARAGGFGGCLSSEAYGCITTNSAYANKYCAAGGGSDCITCNEEPEAVCTWCKGGDDLPEHFTTVSGGCN
jgi:hypothetical protein